jgi:hypothetical protein
MHTCTVCTYSIHILYICMYCTYLLYICMCCTYLLFCILCMYIMYILYVCMYVCMYVHTYTYIHDILYVHMCNEKLIKFKIKSMYHTVCTYPISKQMMKFPKAYYFNSNLMLTKTEAYVCTVQYIHTHTPHRLVGLKVLAKHDL